MSMNFNYVDGINNSKIVFSVFKGCEDEEIVIESVLVESENKEYVKNIYDNIYKCDSFSSFIMFTRSKPLID